MFRIGEVVKVSSQSKPVTNNHVGRVIFVSTWDQVLITVKLSEVPFVDREFTYKASELKRIQG